VSIQSQVMNAVNQRIGGAERDRSAQMWLRVVLMRFDNAQFDGPNLANHLAYIAKQIQSKDPPVRLQAIAALAFIGKKGAAKTAEIAEALKFDDANAVTAAIAALASFGPDAAKAVPALEAVKASYTDPDLSKEEVEAVKKGAAEAIEVILGRKKAPALPKPPEKKAEVPKAIEKK
jgi:hypothetical protein